MGQVDNRCLRPPIRSIKHPLNVQRRAIQPCRKGWRGNQAVEPHGQTVALLLGIEAIDVENAQFAHGWTPYLGDELRQVQVPPIAPGLLDDIGQEDMFRTGDGIGVDFGKRQNRRNQAFYLIAGNFSLSGNGPIQFGRDQRADYIDRYTSAGSGRIDRELGGGCKHSHAIRPDAPFL